MTDPRLTLLMVLLGCLVLIIASGLRLVRMGRADVLAARIAGIHAGRVRVDRGRKRRVAGLSRVAEHVGALLLRYRLVPKKTVHEAELLLAGINLHGDSFVAAYLGGRLLLLVFLPALVWFGATAASESGKTSLIAVVVAAILALLAPDMLLGRRRRRRLIAIEAGMPDALDLMVICLDAGLAFEPALERVTRDIAPVHPEIAEEFGLTVNALRIATDRRAVLMDMGVRLNGDFIRRFASTLVQSMQIGAPLSRALHMLGQELRQDQMIKFEAKAGRLPVLLTLPMVAFIMPTVLLVVGGPAAVQLLHLR